MSLDYMRALQNLFGKEPGKSELEADIERLHRELTGMLDKLGCKKLLQLLDALDEHREQLALLNFVEGFRLAAGIIRELSLEEPYSFDREEERRASRENIEN